MVLKTTNSLELLEQNFQPEGVSQRETGRQDLNLDLMQLLSLKRPEDPAEKTFHSCLLTRVWATQLIQSRDSCQVTWKDLKVSIDPAHQSPPEVRSTEEGFSSSTWLRAEV